MSMQKSFGTRGIDVWMGGAEGGRHRRPGHVVSRRMGGGWRGTRWPRRTADGPPRCWRPTVESVRQLNQASVNPKSWSLGKLELKRPFWSLGLLFYFYFSFKFLKSFIEVQLAYNVVFDFCCTAKWFSYTHTYILFHILFHYGLSQDIEYSSLC